MPPPYQEPHWTIFANIPHQPQGPVGAPPMDWAGELPDVPQADNLPLQQLNRHEVRNICRNPQNEVLFGYLCAMAWGGQRSQNAQSAWNNRAQIAERCQQLYEGGLTAHEAFDLFADEPIPHFGIPFFTKLLFFFSPDPGFYIMDQWTAKSVNLLNAHHPNCQCIHVTPRGWVDWQNDAATYQSFCNEIYSMAHLLQCDGQSVEERLFSKGGHNPWPWRCYVRNH